MITKNKPHIQNLHTLIPSQRKKQSLQQICKNQLLQPSISAMRFLCTTQALEPHVCKSSWDIPQDNYPGIMVGGCGTQNSTMTYKQDKDSWAFASPGIQYCYSWVGCFPVDSMPTGSQCTAG